MFYGEEVPVTPYYVKNKKMIDEKFPTLLQEERQIITQVDRNGDPVFIVLNSWTRNIMPVLDAMFEMEYFRKIEAYDQDLIRTCEYKNALPDFVNLEYDPRLCCRESTKRFYDHEYSRVYYADFETDPTPRRPNPHIPYLCCVISRLGNEIERIAITKNFGNNLLNCLNNLENDSLCYFHNIQYWL
jgi:hypothetical protein